MPKHPLISIPLDIPDVRVLQTELTKDRERILTVESTLISTICRRCGRTITAPHGRDAPRLLRHLPILGQVVYLRIRPKRFHCPWCHGHPTTTQTLDWYDPNALHTNAYERHRIRQLVNSTLTVCTAMWEAYSTAVEQVLPAAQIVIDRFHVACHDHDAVDDLRKQEVRRLTHELPADAVSELKHTLWPFRKRATDLDPVAQARLDTLLAHSPALRQAYTLREQLTNIFDTARSKADGLRRMRFWRRRVVKSGLRCFAGFLKLLDTWPDRIANYFIDHQTSSFVEGLNNKLKVLKRRCYGLRNVAHLFQRRTLDLEGYRRFSPWRAPTSSGVSGKS